MAGKGTYSAYLQRPQVSSGQFEGSDAFARMAASKASQKEKSKAYQRKALQEGRKAVQNAIDAGKVDLSQFDQSVYSVVSKMLDNYGDKVVDAYERLEDGYSYQDELAITKMASDFRTNISSLLGISNSIKSIQKMNLDPILSLEAINGLSDFTKGVPGMAEKFDPETMSVGGKNIVEMYNEMVPKDKLVPFTDTSKAFSEFAEVALTKPRKDTNIVGDEEITYSIRDYKEGEEGARSAFVTYFSPESREFKKESMRLLQMHEGLEGNQKKQFEAMYMEKTADGDYIVTPDSLFNYVRDNRLENMMRVESERKDIEPDSLTATQRDKKNKALMTNLRKIEVLHQAATSDGMTGWIDEPIMVDGVKGTIKKAELRFNPVTKKRQIAVTYSIGDDKRVASNVAWFDNNEAGIQALGNSIFDDFDYVQAKREASVNVDVNLDVPNEVRDFPQRQEDIDLIIKNGRDAIADKLKMASQAGDLREGTERVYADYIAQSFEESGEKNEGLMRFMASYLDLDDDFVQGMKLPEKYDLGNNKMVRKTGGVFGFFQKEEEIDLVKASEKIAKFSTIARRMKNDGATEDEIMKELVSMAKKDTDIEMDPIKREIIDLTGNNTNKRSEYLSYASKLLRQGLDDDEVITELRRGIKKGGARAVEIPESVINNITNAHNVTEEQARTWLIDFAKREGITVEQAISLLP